MKLGKSLIIGVIAFLLLFPASVASATSVSDFKELTWSSDIQKDTTYSWQVDNLSLNGTPVNNPALYGFIDGAIIRIKVLVELSEINLMDFVNDTIKFPDARDYVEVSVNEIEIEFKLYNAVVFIVPSEVTITEGDTNAFFILKSSNIVVFSSKNEYNPVSNEYREYDDSENSEEFVWDANTGLLKTIKINYTSGFQFELNLKDDANLTIDEAPVMPIWLASVAVGVVALITKRKFH